MSKVKNFIFDKENKYASVDHEHTKLKHQLRRKTKSLLNKKRKNKKYASYTIIDQKPVYQTRQKWIPEKTVDIKQLNIRTIYLTDKNGKPMKYKQYSWDKTGEKVIPAHFRKERIYKGTKPVKPYIKKFHVPKKWARKLASRKLRNTDGLWSNGLYKKVFDVAWKVY